jgi:KTSC domain
MFWVCADELRYGSLSGHQSGLSLLHQSQATDRQPSPLSEGIYQHRWRMPMLSNCAECQYFHPDACGVNPHYREKTAALCSKLSPAELKYWANDLSSCPDWERSKDLELQTHSLTLTRAQWRELADAIASHQESASQGLADALPEELRPAAPEDSGEIRMREVESSNIAAIGYRGGVCQVDFLSGSRYRYFEVPDVIYQDFLTADSKGRYLNEVFKIEFAFEYEQVY